MSLGRALMFVGWPAFLAACGLELVVFALVDPSDLQWAGQGLELPRQAVYTAGFFAFWLLAMSSSALTLLLAMPADAPGGEPEA